jgi:hypothetical protein
MMTRTMTTAAVVAVTLGIAGPAFAQARGLEGVWGVLTQNRNCTTNAAIGSPTHALVTYHADGTISESQYIPVFAVGQVSESHGSWGFSGGGTFAARFVRMINFDTAAGTPPGSPGFQAGWMVGTQTFDLTGPDSFTQTGSTQFFNLNRQVYRVGCASRVGERFK